MLVRTCVCMEVQWRAFSFTSPAGLRTRRECGAETLSFLWPLRVRELADQRSCWTTVCRSKYVCTISLSSSREETPSDVETPDATILPPSRETQPALTTVAEIAWTISECWKNSGKING